MELPHPIRDPRKVLVQIIQTEVKRFLFPIGYLRNQPSSFMHLLIQCQFYHIPRLPDAGDLEVSKADENLRLKEAMLSRNIRQVGSCGFR